jgi:hypothetical protein
MNTKLLALYGLKWHPFTTEVPTEAIHVPARLEHFCWRIERGLIGEGGFAMIHGDPGTGKSVALRLLAERLVRLPDLTVGAIGPSAEQPRGFLSRDGRSLRCAAASAQPLGRLQGACARRGSPIWSRPGAARCCSSTRPRR